MLSKKFVSLYFSSSGLLLLELTPNKKKVKVAHRIDLPEGLLSEYRVTDTTLLAEIIATLFKKLKISQKSVGVVLPEFTALTKALQIPSIEEEDLEEAISWQIQEFLPWEIEDTIYDWKIIEKNEGGYLILMVAVEKSTLASYSEAIVKAGLFPVVVEVPSLSLVRLSKSGDIGKLIFYLGKGQNLVILTTGEKLISSSVSAAGSEDELIDIGKKMVQHFDSVEIESVELGGQALTSEFAAKLSSAFSLKITLLGERFSEIPKDVLQTFLVPISLQFKETAKPSDTATINLLPENLVKKYEYEKLKLQIWSLTLAVSYFVWVTFFATFGAYLFLSQQTTSLKSADTLLRATDPEKVEMVTNIQNTNKLASQVLSIASTSIYPQEILNDIYRARPETVSVDHYKVDLESGQIGISGVSKDRNSLIVFKHKIEENANFSLVSIPISSLEVDKNLKYTMTFSYLPISSKVKTKQK